MAMYKITVPQAQEVIEHVGIRHRIPIMFWGEPGAGKTDGVYQKAEEVNALMCDVRLGQYDSVDIRGIPGISANDNQTVWHPPSTLPFKGNPKFSSYKGLIFLFLDELTSAIPAVFGVAYQLINERRAGEHELLDNVVIIAAGNRDGDRGVTNRMPLPLCNRLVHYEVGTDVDAWCYWAQRKLPPEAASVGMAFLQFRKPLLSTFNPQLPDKNFATPRTWEKALRFFADKDMPLFCKQASMAGAVGDGVAAEFWGFVDVWHKMIPMAEIEKNPKKAKVPAEDEASMQYALAIAISGTMEVKNVGAFHTYLKRMPPEFVVLAWQLAIKRDQSLLSAPEFLDFSKEYRAVFQ